MILPPTSVVYTLSLSGVVFWCWSENGGEKGVQLCCGPVRCDSRATVVLPWFGFLRMLYTAPPPLEWIFGGIWCGVDWMGRDTGDGVAIYIGYYVRTGVILFMELWSCRG